MKTICITILSLILISFNYYDRKELPEELQVDTVKKVVIRDTLGLMKKVDSSNEKLTVLVLYPYDRIANEGGSPDMREIIRKILEADSSLRILSYPVWMLHGGGTYAVYAPVYCKEIVEKLHPDIIIMSKIDLLKWVDNLPGRFWRVEVKAYFPKKGNTVIIYHNDSIQSNGSIEKDMARNLNVARLKK